ncbi:biopolymer transporter ExbD [uncultured Desulfosarcina sp.]|jgi:biopolymer transport protein ExbD|uniref:ExbD/TolR family protein n=1 Tax=uncultured Desulfosarcina sp. TaxID=218289 RepID=UPI0029C807B1|nr:biopolymer transporter ExbD [uncultured Desulfosarcina sp.]
MRRNLFDIQGFDEINVTPLLDLAWTLLVVFIIAVTASVQGIKVNLPKASNTPSLVKPRTKAITIRADGQIYLDAYPVTLAELETMLRQHKAVDPDFPVVIKGDDKIYYQNVVSILDLLTELEITQLGLVTQKLVK